MNNGSAPMWKVLVYDSIGQSILAPIFSVKELRELGVTLHIGTIHILRNHLQGGRGLESANFGLFSVNKTCLRRRGGGIKSLKMCLRNI